MLFGNVYIEGVVWKMFVENIDVGFCGYCGCDCYDLIICFGLID